MGVLKWLGLDMGPEKDPLSLTDSNFAQIVRKNDKPVLIDVWGPGCAPCNALAPTIKRLAAKYEGQVDVCELNAAANPKTMSKLGVRGTPTVIFYSKGREIERVVGVRSQTFFEQLIDEEIGPQTEENMSVN